MLFMPLQFAWAGVSVYCQHESGAPMQHLGHHEHGHQGDESPAESGSKPHADCGFCQEATAALLEARSLAVFDPSWVFGGEPHAFTESAATPEPERPKWRSAA